MVSGNLGEALDFLRGGPFYFDEVDDLGFAEAEVEAEIGLGHDARAAVDLVDLGVGASDNANASSDCGAVARGADEFEFDPILRVAAIVAKKRRQVTEIQHESVNVAIIVVVTECRAAA